MKSTPAARIPSWRGKLKDAIVHTIDDVTVHTVQDVERVFKLNKTKFISVSFLPKLKLPSHPTENVPVIHFDRFVTMAYQHMATKNNTAP